MTDLSLTCRRTIRATPEQVYNAWLDPKMILKYMTMGPDMRALDAKSDPRVGGRFSFLMQGEQAHPHAGTYLVLEPHSHIAFSWEAPWSAPESRVDLTLTPVDGGTEVVLTHVKFVSEQSRDNHTKGWTGILDRLDGMLA
jgi:uncharacterized protein YndB with AHSA1/START domain